MKEIKKIAIFDTSICTENIGDKIIMDAALINLNSIFGDAFYINFPTHDKISRASYNRSQSAHYRFVCGTNLLSSNMNVYNQWLINLKDAIFLSDITLLGVGWWQYQKKPNWYTKLLLKRVLSDEKIHSVRDSYTENQLKSIGIYNVINTSCPTMWSLTMKHCKKIPTKKTKKVITTLTDYNKNIKSDKFIIRTLLKNYEEVYFWIQSFNDIDYIIKELEFNENQISFVPPTIERLDSILLNEDVDYVGTRLHAGIRALQKKIRTIIIGIDNRAFEKSKDFNLCVIDRKEVEEKLENLINQEFKTEISIPEKNIKIWKEQFI